jgi:hypothetical protein
MNSERLIAFVILALLLFSMAVEYRFINGDYER